MQVTSDILRHRMLNPEVLMGDLITGATVSSLQMRRTAALMFPSSSLALTASARLAEERLGPLDPVTRERGSRSMKEEILFLMVTAT